MKILKAMFVICVCLSCVAGCGKNKDEKQKTTEAQRETAPVRTEDFEFQTNSVNFENGNSIFDIKVKNTSDSEKYINEFIMHVKDANGEDLANLFGNVNGNIEAGGERIISCSFGGDLSNYSKLEFELAN